MTDFEIRTTTRQHTAAIKMTRPLAQIGPAMGEAFPKIYHALVSSRVEPAGMPLARALATGATVAPDRLKPALEGVRTRVERGDELASALAEPGRASSSSRRMRSSAHASKASSSAPAAGRKNPSTRTTRHARLFIISLSSIWDG